MQMMRLGWARGHDPYPIVQMMRLGSARGHDPYPIVQMIFLTQVGLTTVLTL
ncbi:MAG: hypothetical protein VKK80_11690 [Prochlorothrix sp.]|nr:hypothetical protein [Prochlorothrix sp.]